MLIEYKMMEELRNSQINSGKINIRNEERFSILRSELSYDSKIEMKFAG